MSELPSDVLEALRAYARGDLELDALYDWLQQVKQVREDPERTFALEALRAFGEHAQDHGVDLREVVRELLPEYT